MPPTQPYAAPPAQPYAAEPYAPEPYAPDATQPFSWDEFAATQSPPPAPLTVPFEQPTEAYTVQPWQPTSAPSPPAPGPAAPTSAIDSLFGDQQFQEYEDLGVLKTVQAPTAGDTHRGR
ncbi:MAG: hypothetical protein WDM88_06870 [Galbitalea sp.]